MKPFSSVAVLVALYCLTGQPVLGGESEQDGIAVAIVYDTSGSMRDNVPDRSGHSAPKYVIANRALVEIVRQISFFTTNSPGSPRKVSAALFTFRGENPQESVKFAPFNPAPFLSWARQFAKPNGNTPLGRTLEAAARSVLASDLAKKHVLVITDGVNTVGPQPAAVMPNIRRMADEKHAAVSVHFVAFDVDAKEFESVKKLGATVVGAADEKQLGTQLDYILQRKILLEEEEKK